MTGRKMDAAPAAAAAAAGGRAPRADPRPWPARRSRRRPAAWRASTAWTSPGCTGSGPRRRDPGRRHHEAPRACAAPARAAAAALRAAPARPAAPPAAAPRAASTDTGAVSSIGKIMAERTTQSWTHGAALLRHARRGCHRTSTPRATRRVPDDRALARREGDAHRHPGGGRRARRCASFPRMNGSWNNGSIAMHAEVNVALAMAVENAVVTAVIKNADPLALGDIAKQRKELTERARANRLTPADIQRRHLHHQQSRDDGSGRVHGDHRAAAGGHPGRGRDQGSGGGARAATSASSR